MGQTSLPSLNKSGVFSYWNGLWDSQYQYAFLLTRFAYLELFFCKLFKDSILISNFFVLKTKDSTSLYFFKNFSYKLEMPVESKRFIRFIFCTSKLWVLKFGGWIILSIYILDTALRKIQPKKKKKMSLKISQSIRKTTPTALRYIFLKGRKRLKLWNTKKLAWKKVVTRTRLFIRSKKWISSNRIFSISQKKLMKSYYIIFNKRKLLLRTVKDRKKKRRLRFFMKTRNLKRYRFVSLLSKPAELIKKKTPFLNTFCTVEYDIF